MHTPLSRTFRCTLVALAAAVLTASCARERGAPSSDTGNPQASASAAPAACAGGNGGLTLPTGFCATVFADSIGHARHLAVSPSGVVYVNTWSGAYYSGKQVQGGFVVALRDANGDGRADTTIRFGLTPTNGGHGGTGIALYKGALYVEEGPAIVRYALSDSSPVPSGKPETVVSGLPLSGDHPMHPFAIDQNGMLYVDLGSATNSCQSKNRVANVPGIKPCTELQTRGGIWQYDANKTGQRFSAKERFATGIRNAVGIAIGPDGVYSTQHGRDQLFENWKPMYTEAQGTDLPAEELLHIEKGNDYGWPMCYFDGEQKKLVLAPEYGGDGGKAVGDCGAKVAPVAFFPAHWAPDDLLFYTGTAFPEKYRGGAFIAFHGSWNRAAGQQGGYLVAFQPMSGGKASGDYETFADGFAGATKDPSGAVHRPAGLGMGPDGALYIADDKGGTVWRVTYGAKP